MQNKSYLYYIDKTERLEEGIGRFPSIYIEGNAASGKSVAVNMLLEKHPEVESCIVEVGEELRDVHNFMESLCMLKEKLAENRFWVIFENLPKKLDDSIVDFMAKMVREIPNESKVIFVSREKPQIELLDLLWKCKMELIPAEKLLLSCEEVQKLAGQRNSSLCAETVYEKTGGWPGCVDLLFRLSGNGKSAEELLESYEMKSYIQQKILAELDFDEMQLLRCAAGCPWISVPLCNDIWPLADIDEKLENLQRKGLLLFESDDRRWRIAPLFGRYITGKFVGVEKASVWYKANGHIKEALECFKQAGEKNAYRECMLQHYDKVYAMGLVSEEVLTWTTKDPEECYLRGVYHYNNQNFEELAKEISSMQRIKEKNHLTKEILLNLSYMNIEMSTIEWLELLAEYTQKGEKFRLYQILGNSVTYLCGIRDLSAMLACTKKQEKHWAQLWKTAFGEFEWKCYQLARIDYYLETEQREFICEEDWELLRQKNEQNENWQLRMAKLYILCKLQRIQKEDARVEHIRALEKSLCREKNSICSEIAEAISSIYAPWYGVRERMSKWLRYTMMDSTIAINEDNYVVFFCRAKGYVLLNQYERAEKILKKLVPYLKEYHRYRLAAEALFQYALVNWGKDLKGQCIKNAIESFMVSRNSRYVGFYAGYGQKGKLVLEAYMEWMISNAPEGWTYKKKYKYGNVLRMPVGDYMQVILRCTKKVLKSEGNLAKEKIQERLTMMETIVLQDIGMGKSNAEIAEELELKLPTVKGHIYSLFKKLEVNSRVQAVLKGKELGILE